MMGRGGDRTAHLIVPTPCPHPPRVKKGCGWGEGEVLITCGKLLHTMVTFATKCVLSLWKNSEDDERQYQHL